MKYYERRTKSGSILEVIRYASLREPGVNFPRGQNQCKSSTAQILRNLVNAQKNLVRLINANFGPGDLLLVLTYEGKPPSPNKAKKDLKKYVRRLREYGKKTGIIIKWIAVTEYREGKRIHHHIIISGIGADMARLLWQTEPDPNHRGQRRKWAGHGRAPYDPLDSSGDYESWANYIDKEDKPGEHRWTSSRNLTKPEIGPPREIDPRKMTKALKNPTAPKGYRLIDWNIYAGWDGHLILYLKCKEWPEKTTRKKPAKFQIFGNSEAEICVREFLSGPP